MIDSLHLGKVGLVWILAGRVFVAPVTIHAEFIPPAVPSLRLIENPPHYSRLGSAGRSRHGRFQRQRSELRQLLNWRSICDSDTRAAVNYSHCGFGRQVLPDDARPILGRRSVLHRRTIESIQATRNYIADVRTLDGCARLSFVPQPELDVGRVVWSDHDTCVLYFELRRVGMGQHPRRHSRGFARGIGACSSRNSDVSHCTGLSLHRRLLSSHHFTLLFATSLGANQIDDLHGRGTEQQSGKHGQPERIPSERDLWGLLLGVLGGGLLYSVLWAVWGHRESDQQKRTGRADNE